MATLLYRLGRFSYRRRALVTVIWLVLLTGAGVGAVKLSGPTSDAFSIPGTESQQAIDLLKTRMPSSSVDSATARVVFLAGQDGTLTDATAKAAVESAVARLKTLPNVASVTDPYTSQAVSQDRRTAFAVVTYTVKAVDLTEADQSKLFTAGRTAQPAGLTVEFGGDAAQEKIGQSPAEGIGLVAAAVVLVITFGSLLAAGLPLLTAIVGVALGLLGVTIATGFTTIGSSTSTLALMLGLAVGIDYALFIVSRYRHELLVGHDGEDAAGRAVGTAGSAIAFAGATVVIALAALTVAGIPFLTAMGLAAAGTVFGAVLIALTLLPAVLGFLGRRVLGRSRPGFLDTENGGRRAPLGERWARLVVRRRVPVLLAVIAGLGVLAVPSLDLRLGMPSDTTASPDTTQRKAYDALAAGFGPGFNGPLVIAADLSGADDRTAAVKTIQADLEAVQDVSYVSAATVNPAGNTAVYTVVPKSGPTETATEDLVHAIRAKATGWRAATGASVFVTGATAVAIDVSSKLSNALLPYLVVVVGLAFVLLALVFRSLLVPLKATAGFLLSLFATFGAVVLVFQKGWLASYLGVDTTGPVLSFLPILLIGVLFGLAMDYEVFLVTRMREEHVHGAEPDDAVVHGFKHSARVVTAAAIIMVSVFAGFIFSSETIVKSMGFALASGVVIDAFLIRMVVVPAVMSLLGQRAWALPRWLDRAMPDIDVEGQELTRTLTAARLADATDERHAVLEPIP
jgi:putative drug exporter of the RND superfamily